VSAPLTVECDGWGIPTFHEQVDKNITSTLKQLDDPSKGGIAIELQHRLNSTGNSGDAALVWLTHCRRSFCLEAIGATGNADEWFKI
jgi:hypothetical protein